MEESTRVVTPYHQCEVFLTDRNEGISASLASGNTVSSLLRKDWRRSIAVGTAVGLGVGVAVGNYLIGFVLGVGIALAMSLRSITTSP